MITYIKKRVKYNYKLSLKYIMLIRISNKHRPTLKFYVNFTNIGWQKNTKNKVILT